MATQDGVAATVLACRYELGPIVGQGGMAVVYRAKDLRLDRQVAVKILRAELAGQPESRHRFEAEARAAARVEHPNVVAVYDSGEDGEIPFLVTECLSGRTLNDELADGPLSPERLRNVLREILAALQAAHAAGVIATCWQHPCTSRPSGRQAKPRRRAVTSILSASWRTRR